MMHRIASAALCLMLLTNAGAAELRQPLDVWCIGSQCANESAFWDSYHTDGEFRRQLDQYFVVRKLLIRHLPVQALLKGIIAGPTFAVPGRPLVVGFRGPSALLNELGVPATAAQRSEWERSAPPHNPRGDIIDPAAIKESLSGELRDALEAARQADRAAVAKELQTLQRRLDSQETGGGQLPQDVLRYLQQVAGELAALRQKINAQGRTAAPSALTTPGPEPVPKAPPAHSSTGASARHAPGRIMTFLLDSLPWLVPLAGGGGTVGALLLAARFLSRGAAGVGRTATESRCPECESLRDQLAAVRRKTEESRDQTLRAATTNFAPYETSHFREAFQYAVRETVSRYPGAADSMVALESLITQYLASKGIKK